MYLSTRTLDILNNFTKINPSLIVEENVSILSSMNISKSFMGKAKVTETFPKAFAIFDLKRFLGVLSLFENPDLTFSDTYVRIEGDNQKAKYVYAEPSALNVPTQNIVTFPEPDVCFTVTSNDLKAINDACAIMQFEEVAIIGDGDMISLRALKSGDASAGEYRVDVGESSKEFRVIIKQEYLSKIILDTYEVALANNEIAQFRANDLVYWIGIATEND